MDTALIYFAGKYTIVLLHEMDYLTSVNENIFAIWLSLISFAFTTKPNMTNAKVRN